MQAWALIIFFHVGPFGDTDSVATSVVPGFETQVLCQRARTAALALTQGTRKEAVAVCVQTK